MKKMSVNGKTPPTLLELVIEILEKKESPVKALTLALRWLYAKPLQGDKLTVKIEEWIENYGPVTEHKVLNFVKDHHMDADIVAPLAIPVCLKTFGEK